MMTTSRSHRSSRSPAPRAARRPIAPRPTLTTTCHGDPGHNVWICGPTATDCYTGMVTERLVNLSNPTASPIADSKNSPIIWIDPSGFTPQDLLSPFPEGHDAILAWVAARAQDN